MELKIVKSKHNKVGSFQGATTKQEVVIFYTNKDYQLANNLQTDLFFYVLIAHEAVHLKQIQNNKTKYFKARTFKTLDIKNIIVDEAEAYFVQALVLNGLYYPDQDKEPLLHKLIRKVERHYKVPKNYLYITPAPSHTNFTKKQIPSITHSINYYTKDPKYSNKVARTIHKLIIENLQTKEKLSKKFLKSFRKKVHHVL